MKTIEKKFKNVDGSEEVLVISSDDDNEIKCKGKMKLANSLSRKTNKMAERFKSSILGADIGINSAGFGNVAIMATIITVFAAVVLYFTLRI